jgi:NOL1/NOP2/fmu family ribosome biogenesis protein
LAEEDERLGLLSYMHERFGIKKELFDDYLLFAKKRTFWFLRKSNSLSEVSHLKIKRLGIKAFQEVGSFIKPTTRFIQYFGGHATKAIFTIDEKQLKQLLSGDSLPYNYALENGYVILSLKGEVLGLGLLIKGMVRSQLAADEVRYMAINGDQLI